MLNDGYYEHMNSFCTKGLISIYIVSSFYNEKNERKFSNEE